MHGALATKQAFDRSEYERRQQAAIRVEAFVVREVESMWFPNSFPALMKRAHQLLRDCLEMVIASAPSIIRFANLK